MAGAIDADCVDALRAALFAALRPGCRDVLVDAGGVTEITEPALAVLLAAPEWIDYQGGRFLLSASSIVRLALSSSPRRPCNAGGRARMPLPLFVRRWPPMPATPLRAPAPRVIRLPAQRVAQD